MTIKIRFENLDKTLEVDPKEFPLGDHGEPGSILDIALAHGIDLEHACGGSCACSTCHVIVTEGQENLSEMEDAEADQLDLAAGLTLNSRLGCQAVVRGDVSVRIPQFTVHEPERAAVKNEHKP